MMSGSKSNFAIMISSIIVCSLFLQVTFLVCGDSESKLSFDQEEAIGKLSSPLDLGFLDLSALQKESDFQFVYTSDSSRIYFSESEISYILFENGEYIHFNSIYPDALSVKPEATSSSCSNFNYYHGNIKIKNVQVYEKITYYDLFPGIDVVYTITDMQLQQNFIIHPECKTLQIQMEVSGEVDISVTDFQVNFLSNKDTDTILMSSNLYGSQPDSELIQALFIDTSSNDRSGYSIQLNNNHVQTNFAIAPRTTDFSQTSPEKSFIQSNYNMSLSLQPIYASYIGGSGWDWIRALEIGLNGHAYMTGCCEDPFLFPDENYTYSGDARDCFVMEMTNTGEIVSLTIIGGNENDEGLAIDVDAEGNVFLTGFTASADFPTVHAYDSTHNGLCDSFVIMLNSTGWDLEYSTYFGGSHNDFSFGIGVASDNTVVVSGYGQSVDFPIISGSGYQGEYDCFIYRLNLTSSDIIYSTYYGGSGCEWMHGLTMDADDNIYIVGDTESTDFPTVNAISNSCAGWTDVFLVKMSLNASHIFYSTYIGSEDTEEGHGITVDNQGYAYITGYTNDWNLQDFPTTIDVDRGAALEGFLTKVSQDGSEIIFSRYIGGSGHDKAHHSCIDEDGNIIVSGITSSDDFPIINGYNQYNFLDRAFLCIFDPSGENISHSAAIYGADIYTECLLGIDNQDHFFLAGDMESGQFPHINTTLEYNPESDDGYVAIFTFVDFSLVTSETTTSFTTNPWLNTTSLSSSSIPPTTTQLLNNTTTFYTTISTILTNSTPTTSTNQSYYTLISLSIQELLIITGGGMILILIIVVVYIRHRR